MKIKINKFGHLQVNEVGKICPFLCLPELNGCGEWCAQFDIDYPVNTVRVNLCHNKQYQCNYADFTDERKAS